MIPEIISVWAKVFRMVKKQLITSGLSSGRALNKPSWQTCCWSVAIKEDETSLILYSTNSIGGSPVITPD